MDRHTRGSSPLTRGTLGYEATIETFEAVHPRLRGELKIAAAPNFNLLGSSPLTRGTLSVCDLSLANIAVHPRLRGELCFFVVVDIIERGSSPLTRGTHKIDDGLTNILRFIPAYAGNSRTETVPKFL